MSKLQDAEIRALVERVRAVGGVKIVAATKTRTADEINRLPSFGITAVGENRVQELLAKYDDLAVPEIHFIGALQTNKVKYIVDKVCMIQSVDRIELGREIDKRCAPLGKIMDVLVEVNYGEEASKSGCAKSECIVLARELDKLPHLRVRGLMSVLPVDAPEEMYVGMRKLFDELRSVLPVDVLSMGMSGDYMTAIRCGATMIRPGSALFGARPAKLTE